MCVYVLASFFFVTRLRRGGFCPNWFVYKHLWKPFLCHLLEEPRYIACGCRSACTCSQGIFNGWASACCVWFAPPPPPLCTSKQACCAYMHAVCPAETVGSFLRFYESAAPFLCGLFLFRLLAFLALLAWCVCDLISCLPAPSVERGDVTPTSTRPSPGLVQVSGNAWKLRAKGFQGRLNAPMLRTWRQVGFFLWSRSSDCLSEMADHLLESRGVSDRNFFWSRSSCCL